MTVTWSCPRQVQFASIMETLGNEALGKIVNIVEEADLHLELESRTGDRRPQISFLHVNGGHVGRHTGHAPSSPSRFTSPRVMFANL